MNLKENLYSAFQGFLLGSIVMAYIADYNKEQLPIAFMFLAISVLSRLASNLGR